MSSFGDVFFSQVEFDEVQFQFVLCELSKLLMFLGSGDERYTREYARRRRV